MTLTDLVTVTAATFNATARETALNNPRAMNAWDKAKRALAELKEAAAVIDEVARATH